MNSNKKKFHPFRSFQRHYQNSNYQYNASRRHRNNNKSRHTTSSNNYYRYIKRNPDIESNQNYSNSDNRFPYGAQLNFLKRESEESYKQGYKLESARINERILFLGKEAFNEFSDRQKKTIIIKSVMCINDYEKLGYFDDSDRAAIELKNLLIKNYHSTKDLSHWYMTSSNNKYKNSKGCRILEDFFYGKKKEVSSKFSDINRVLSENGKNNSLSPDDSQDDIVENMESHMNINAKEWHCPNGNSRLTSTISKNTMSMYEKYRRYHPSLKNNIKEDHDDLDRRLHL